MRKLVFLKIKFWICKLIIVGFFGNSIYINKDNGFIRLFERIYGFIFIYKMIVKKMGYVFFSRSGRLKRNNIRVSERKEWKGIIEFKINSKI